MNPSLTDWHPRGWNIESEVRIILLAHKAKDMSTAACQRWAWEYIQRFQPEWTPDVQLTWREWQVIGAAFTKEVQAAWLRLPKKVRAQHPLVREL